MGVSFIHDIEEALIGELQTRLGLGTTEYPEPEYLQLRFIGRAGGRPVPLLPDQEYPALWIEYLAGTPRQSEVGHPWATQATEAFNILGVLRLTPEILDCPEDLTIFTREAEAAAGILLRRLMLTLTSFDPSVIDDLLGYKTNGQRLGGWAYNGITKGVFVIDYTMIVRYESLVVI